MWIFLSSYGKRFYNISYDDDFFMEFKERLREHFDNGKKNRKATAMKWFTWALQIGTLIISTKAFWRGEWWSVFVLGIFTLILWNVFLLMMRGRNFFVTIMKKKIYFGCYVAIVMDNGCEKTAKAMQESWKNLSKCENRNPGNHVQIFTSCPNCINSCQIL